MPYTAARRVGEKAPLVSGNFSEMHRDPYLEELGPGVPVYSASAIKDDRTSRTSGTTSTVGCDSSEDDDSSWDTEKPKLGNNHDGKQQTQCTFYTPGGRPSNNELWRFRARGCQDCWAALFLAALVAVVLLWGMEQVWQLQLTERDLAVIGGIAEWGGYAKVSADADATGTSVQGKVLRRTAALRAGVAALWARMGGLVPPAEAYNSDPSPSSSYADMTGSIMRVLIWCAAAAATTILAAYGGLLLIAVYPRQLIFIQSAVASMLSVVSAGVALAQGALLTAMLFGLTSLMPLLWIYLIQDRIPFTATMLCATVSLLRRHRSLFIISLSSAIASWCFVVTAVVCVLPSVLRLLAGTAAGKDTVYSIVVVFSVFWVQEVLGALVHVTVCGVVATWYFAGEGRIPSFPVWCAFQRATTTSFGSVCLGSLITAIASFIRFLIDTARSSNDGDSFCMCIMSSLVGCIEDLVRYFNLYAFVHVAVYGCSYVDAAKETWRLVKQCAFSAIFNDSLTGQVIGILTFMSALLVAFLTWLVTWNAGAVTLMFFMSLAVSSIFYNPVSSCVTTLFVCFAEVPVGLQLSFPELYAALVSADAGYTQRRGKTNMYGTALV
ncbi:plasma-membrane choline transporter, putative [Leishmania panamensis]|uniref:Choline transporter-like protein n=1 Tax=Leishmania panamensis TaxID=5679 RepID=A0A088RN12_LEIPA|nr:plasma-membrane choline transporter, putative [Leishmania panamensis]AIN96619.1 plasma-membrane choline transporter, putative [Leishmania panamensis]